MTPEPQDIGSEKDRAPRSPEVDFAVVLSRVITSIEDDPAQLRHAFTSSHASSFGEKLGEILPQTLWRRDA